MHHAYIAGKMAEIMQNVPPAFGVTWGAALSTPVERECASERNTICLLLCLLQSSDASARRLQRDELPVSECSSLGLSVDSVQYTRVCMAGDVSACVCRCVCACVCVDLFERLETEFSYHLTLSRNSLSRSTDIRSSVSPPFGRKMLIGCFFCRLSNRSFALFTTRSARLTQSIERHVSEQRHAPIILRT